MKVLETSLQIHTEKNGREVLPAGTPLTKLSAEAKKAAKAADILTDVLVVEEVDEEQEAEEASE